MGTFGDILNNVTDNGISLAEAAQQAMQSAQHAVPGWTPPGWVAPQMQQPEVQTQPVEQPSATDYMSPMLANIYEGFSDLDLSGEKTDFSKPEKKTSSDKTSEKDSEDTSSLYKIMMQNIQEQENPNNPIMNYFNSLADRYSRDFNIAGEAIENNDSGKSIADRPTPKEYLENPDDYGFSIPGYKTYSPSMTFEQAREEAKQETEQKTDDKTEKEPGPTATSMNDRFTSDEINNMTQREMFERLMEDQAARDYYGSTYGEDILGPYGYENFRDIGTNTDYQYKHDLVRDLFNLNREQADIGLDPWYAMASAAGLVNPEDDEATIQAIMDYMWSPENIIDTNQYLYNNNYAANKSLGNLDSVYRYLMYIQDQGGDMLNRFDNRLDANDAAEYAMAADLMNRIDKGYQVTDKDMGLLNWLMEQSGDTGGFGFMDDGSSYSDHQWTNSGRQYNPGDLATIATYDPKDMPYMLQESGYFGPGVNSPLVSSSLADDLMYKIENSNVNNRKVGRKQGD